MPRIPTQKQLDALKAHQFRPGQSGNPAGPRPSVASEARAAADGGKKVFAVCVAILEDERRAPKDRLEAGKLLLGYAVGTPVAVTANLNVDATEREAQTELARSAMETLARALNMPGLETATPAAQETQDDAA